MPDRRSQFSFAEAGIVVVVVQTKKQAGLAVLVKGSEVVCERDGADDHAGWVDGLGDLGIEEAVHVVEEPRMFHAPLRFSLLKSSCQKLFLRTVSQNL